MIFDAPCLRTPLAFYRPPRSCLLLLLALAGCPHREDPTSATGTRYLQIVLARTSGVTKVVSRRSVPAATPLRPSMGGDHVIVARSGGKQVYAQPFRFPTRIFHEGLEEGRMDTVDDGIVVVQVPLDPTFEELILIDAAHQEQSLGKPFNRSSLSQALETIGQNEVVKAAPHIWFLDAAAVPEYVPERLLAEYFDVSDASRITPKQRERVIAGLEVCSPEMLSGVVTISFARGRHREVLASAYGSAIMINTDALEDSGWEAVMPHEVAHSYTDLLDANFDGIDPEIAKLAQKTIAQYQLGSGFTNLWVRTHDSGAAMKLSGRYRGEDWKSTVDPLAKGFVRKYGSSNPFEDIATYVEAVVAGSKGERAAYCTQLSAATSQFPTQLAIPYTKLQLLRHTGFLTEAQANECFGKTVIEGPVGLYPQDASGAPQLSCGSGVKGGWVDEDGAEFLVVLGNCGSYSMSVRVLAPGHKPPLGLHRLDGIWQHNLDAANNAVYFGHAVPDKERVSRSGLVLVNRVDAKRIEGAIFFLGIGSDLFDVTEVFPLVTFRYDN